jgi:hypothetical protein
MVRKPYRFSGAVLQESNNIKGPSRKQMEAGFMG